MQPNLSIERNFTIDLLKCLAALLITNSHFDSLYVSYSALGTGGAIGDVLFFFCSGFTLFSGQNDAFGSWYKRRIIRIYPSVIMILLFHSAFYGRCITWQDIMLVQWAWFIPCIMIYYLILYFIRNYMPNQIGFVFTFVVLLTIALFLIDIRKGEVPCIYNTVFFKCVFFFLFMLLGAAVGRGRCRFVLLKKMPLLMQFVCLIVSLILFYGIMHMGLSDLSFYDFQLISIIPLLAICLVLYEIFSHKVICSFLQKRFIGYFIRLTSVLALELYFMNVLITTAFNSLFPLNLLIMFAIIYGMAYLLRISSLFFVQTFQEGGYNWKKLIQFV